MPRLVVGGTAAPEKQRHYHVPSVEAITCREADTIYSYTGLLMTEIIDRGLSDMDVVAALLLIAMRRVDGEVNLEAIDGLTWDDLRWLPEPAERLADTEETKRPERQFLNPQVKKEAKNTLREVWARWQHYPADKAMLRWSPVYGRLWHLTAADMPDLTPDQIELFEKDIEPATQALARSALG